MKRTGVVTDSDCLSVTIMNDQLITVGEGGGGGVTTGFNLNPNMEN